MKRLVSLSLLATALFAVPRSALASPAVDPVGVFVGAWHVATYVHCTNSPANARVCGALLGHNWVVLGIRDTALTLSSTSDITVSTTGDFMVEGTTTARERSQATPIACANQDFVDRGFNGTCTWYWWNRGSRVSMTGHWIAFYEKTQASASQRYTAPRFSACKCRFQIPEPGMYLTRRLLAMQGVHPNSVELVGVVARTTVTHTR